jgi:hypothetical protein
VGAWLQHSRLRLCLLLAFTVLFWFLLFAVFSEGFLFIGKYLPVGNELVSNLFGCSLCRCW